MLTPRRVAQVLARDGAGGDAHHGLARRGAPAAAIVAQAVFLLVGVVGVARAEAVLDLVVVARARVGVLDQQADRRAGGDALEHAGEDAHRVAFLALADELRGAGAAAVDVAPAGLLRPARRPGGQPSTTQPSAGPWLSPKVRDRERLAETVTGHSLDLSAANLPRAAARASAGTRRRRRARTRAR